MGKFITRTREDGQFCFDLTTDSGQKLLSSIAYATRDSCVAGMRLVKSNAIFISRYERRRTKNGQYYFNLEERNGHAIATSEMYKIPEMRDNCIRLVQKNAPGALVEEQHESLNSLSIV